MSEVILVAQNLHKVYRSGFEDLHVLKNLTLEVRKGESMAIVGASGTGKSTLLHLLGGLDRPTEGKVLLEGNCLADFSESELARVRNQRFGFVFQFHYLLSEFTALENVRMPASIGGRNLEQATLRAEMLLEKVGLKERKCHKPAELSGGEQQRAAVARALMNEPLILLADEPTGNLDRTTAEGVHALLRELARQESRAFVFATHNEALAQRSDRVVRLVDGQAVEIENLTAG